MHGQSNRFKRVFQIPEILFTQELRDHNAAFPFCFPHWEKEYRVLFHSRHRQPGLVAYHYGFEYGVYKINPPSQSLIPIR